MGNIEKNNSGFLFKNERKEKENHPDYTGSLNYEGEQLWINAWIYTARDGRKYLSISLKPKEESLKETRAHSE